MGRKYSAANDTQPCVSELRHRGHCFPTVTWHVVMYEAILLQWTLRPDAVT